MPFLLQKRANIPEDQIQTYSSAFLAAYAGASVLFSPPAGIIADKLPARQLPFLAGLVALLGATILLWLGQTVAVLIVARILQGISAAVVWTIGLALILDTVGPDKLGVTIGSVFSFISVGELAAPVLGGVVYKKAGDGGVFGMGFALLAIDFIMRLLIIEKKTARKYPKELHEESQDSSAPSREDGDEESAEEPTEEDALMGNGKKEKSFTIAEGQPRWIRKFPILYCLTDSRLVVAEIVALMQATLLSSFDATVPTQAEEVYGFDSLKAGILFIPLVVPYLFLGPVFGKLVDKYGPRPAAVFGFGWHVPALILLRIPHSGGTTQIAIYCVLLALNGVGLGAIGAPSIVEASYVCDGYYRNNEEFFDHTPPYAQLYAINSMVCYPSILCGHAADLIQGLQWWTSIGTYHIGRLEGCNRLWQHERRHSGFVLHRCTSFIPIFALVRLDRTFIPHHVLA